MATALETESKEANETGENTKICSRCGANNPAIARFCGSCSQSLEVSAAPAPAVASAPTNPAPNPAVAPAPSAQMPQPGQVPFPGQPGGFPPAQPAMGHGPQGMAGRPPVPPTPQRSFSMPQFGSGQKGTSVRAAVSSEEAMQVVLNSVLAARGGVIHWSSPTSATFTVEKKEFLSPTIKYNGEVSISAVSPTESQVSVDLKLVWSTIVPQMVMIPISMVISAMFSPYILPFFMILTIGSMAFQLWLYCSRYPGKLSEELLKHIPRGNPMPGGGMPGARGVGGMGVGAMPGGSQPHQPLAPSIPTPAAVSGPASVAIPGHVPMPGSVAIPGRVPMPGEAPAPVEASATESEAAQANGLTALERLNQLKELRDAEAISEEEFEAKRAELLKLL